MPKLTVLIFFSLLISPCLQSQDVHTIMQLKYRLQHHYNNTHKNSTQNTPPQFFKTQSPKQINASYFQKKTSSFKPSGVSGQCYDTSVRLIYKNDTLWTYNDFLTRTKDGNILIPGFDEHVLNDNYYNTAHILKCTPQGDTIWFKKITAGYKNRFIDVYHAFELSDNSIILVGDQDVPEPYNGKEVPLIIKLSPQGDLIWERTYESKYWDIDTTTGGVYFSDCKEEVNGDLYFCGGIEYWDSEQRAAIALKTDNTGNPIWSKGFTIGVQLNFAGMQIKNDSLQLLGSSLVDYGGRIVFGVSLNKNTGDTNYTKEWHLPFNSKDSYNAYPYLESLTAGSNGNYYVYGNTLGDVFSFDTAKPFVHHCILEFTPNLDFVNSTLFESWQKSNGGNSVISVFPDGSGAFTRLQYISGHSSNVLFGSFNQSQITKERVIHYSGRSNLWISNFLNMGNGGQFVTQTVGDSINNYVGIEIDKLHNSDTSAFCLGYDSSITQIVQGIPLLRFDYSLIDSIKSKIFTIAKRSFGLVTGGKLDIISGCEAVSFCNSLKLKTSADTICPFMPVFITVEKNKECGSLPYWSYDSSVVKSFGAVNDSTMKLIFKSPWQGKLTASVDGCSGLISDSIKLTILQAPTKLNLGQDTVICPGNTITLNAKAGYANYKWQDGSTDSLYRVTKPGVYFVETTNACGGVFYDTVIVSAHTVIPLDIGADTSLCSGDTLVIKAPSGFINYQWSPGYNINSTSSQTVKLYPQTTTQYNLAAEKTPGCFAYDSINIIVKEKPFVYIGNDTSFCNGDSVLLNAGSGFKKYFWNTGSSASQISLTNQGTYYVVVTAENNCTAVDTMQVMNVYDNPKVSLANDSSICNGSTILFDAGAGYSSYKWQDGSIAQTFTAAGIGSYYVQVINNYGCTGSDTTIITKINPLPSAFLISDTIKCSYDTLLLQSNQPYDAYLWSTGSTDEYIKIIAPGSYWLQVTDTNTCTQKEYATVSEKQCYNVIYFPNAFTPNNDGINDRFRPKVFGSLQQFHMRIYNRWGTKIFETSDWQQGWNGIVKGILQNNDTFVWIATYQLSGLQPVTQHGLVTIVK